MSDSGWQPAVDNLQSQINSINSEISTLSGQEGSQAAEVMLLSNQVSALQTEVSAIQQQVAKGNVLADLSGASVSNAFGGPALLSFNGNSVLSMPASPSVDEKLFRLTVVGRVLEDANPNTNFIGFLMFGPSLSFPATVLNMNNTNIIQDGLFSFELNCVWNSASRQLIFSQLSAFGERTTTGIIQVGAVQNSLFTAASQTDIQFVFAAQWNNTSNPASLTLSQFRLSLA